MSRHIVITCVLVIGVLQCGCGKSSGAKAIGIEPYPGAKFFETPQMEPGWQGVSYTTSDPAAKVGEFYKGKYGSKAGCLVHDRFAESGRGTVGWKEDGVKYLVMILQHNGQTEITLGKLAPK